MAWDPLGGAPIVTDQDPKNDEEWLAYYYLMEERGDDLGKWQSDYERLQQQYGWKPGQDFTKGQLAYFERVGYESPQIEEPAPPAPPDETIPYYRELARARTEREVRRTGGRGRAFPAI